MGSTTGIQPIGTYGEDSAANNATLLALIPDPDVAPAQAGGGFLDEMSPAAAAQLRVELMAMAAAGVSGRHVVTADEATANEVTIDTGLTTDAPLATLEVSILRAGTVVSDDEVVTDNEDGTFTITEDTNYAITADDVIMWFAKAA